MRFVFRILGVTSVTILAAGLALPAQAQDAFMQVCLQTTPQKMCECISSKLPADKRQAAIEGLRKSNAAMRPGGNLLDPANLSQEQMQGLDAVVIAQANCT
ncbi:MAG: hypothetical protein FJX11_02005 [Alphaproteobacteria bacterium]|nr:hypothetical protein [Alphaproteobacteria bacterium]